VADTTYLIFGLLLCAALAGVIGFTYARRRKDRVEAPKYKMLEDEDDR
jgi:hypothetical protein